MNAHCDTATSAAATTAAADCVSVPPRSGAVATNIPASLAPAATGAVRGRAHDTGAGTLAAQVRHGWRWLVHAGRMLVGMPDYEVYCAHVRDHHPEREPMTREAFFRTRQEARYRGGTGRCC